MIINGIKWWNITLDVTDGWYFRTWWSWMPTSMPVANSNWVGLLRGNGLAPSFGLEPAVAHYVVKAKQNRGNYFLPKYVSGLLHSVFIRKFLLKFDSFFKVKITFISNWFNTWRKKPAYPIFNNIFFFSLFKKVLVRCNMELIWCMYMASNFCQ